MIITKRSPAEGQYDPHGETGSRRHSWGLLGNARLRVRTQYGGLVGIVEQAGEGPARASLRDSSGKDKA